MDSFEARFGGIARLVGVEGLRRLRRARVCVIGVGGVGSWAVEALARSGVGAMTLVDLDDVCISNVNRQLHALSGQFGRPKVEVLEERVRSIHPECNVQALRAFFTAATADELLAPTFDYVFDAIDRPQYKALLAVKCTQRKQPLLMSGGAGGRANPTAIRISELTEATHDRLLREVRRLLKVEHRFTEIPTGLPCVYSVERPVFAQADGSVCEMRPPGADLRLDCTGGYGTATFVTGAYGFAAASHIVRALTNCQTI